MAVVSWQLSVARYQEEPGNAGAEEEPPFIWQLTGERTVGGV
ncbi:MAG: hypothetical protein WBA89_30290 [Microcoleus sp.]